MLVIWLLAALLPFSSGGDDNEPSNDQAQMTSRIVHTKYGAVQGSIVHLEGRNLEPVEVFKGIPYASPPTGSLRFMPPVTAALWSGVKKADR
jgi:neuroligin